MGQRVRTVGVAVLVAVAVIWGGAVWLAPVASLPANTQALVEATGGILTETRQLQAGVGAVQQNLAQVQAQEILLVEQTDRMAEVLVALKEQQRLVSRSRELLADTLEEERTTAALAAQAGETARTVQDSVDRSAGQLRALTAQTDRIRSGSRTIEGQMQELIVVMQGAKENFTVVGRLKEAGEQAAGRTGNFLDRLLETLKGWFTW